MTSTSRRRPLESYNKLGIGALALTCIVVVVAALLIIPKLVTTERTYHADFLQAASLRAGDQVTVAGIKVGTVNDLQLRTDHVQITFKARNDIHLGTETRAAIKLSTILGARYMELSPAPSGELHDHTIPISNTTVPYDLQKTLANATTTFEQVDADHIADSLTTLARGLDGVPEALPQALQNLNALSSVISERRDQISTLLSSTDSLTTMIRDQKANLGTLIVHGRGLLNELTTRRAAVQRLFAGLTALVNRAKAILGDRPAITQMINGIHDLTAMIARHDDLLRNTLQVLPLPSRNVANATGSGTAFDSSFPAGFLFDSWMCAISGRAKQFQLPEYFKDCQPAIDPFPGWPPPAPGAPTP